eukprot:CAMPEP_0197628464 /NCGR_PEP_ID=MMETSP1338-20131121/6767_1 /TAXON_ID=43686 ORGANISM="Pelagodinium beii, Strain RCC1491" /NCGR_SAMPLE_ID=MMETSP1338 /ASSEMBLY_ACC=CAM_ASM_000754 /LENGTH=310 /DNA_ID=CAMNT_0043199445 /DNA_START=45 /DNA_END=977 /DNA_ORIENTATION=+
MASTAGNSTDEEAPLTRKETPEEEHDPEKDPELVVNGGKFTSKTAYAQVTWRFPLEKDPLNILALIYGYLPFAVPITFFFYFVFTRSFMAFYSLVLSLVVTILNEVVLKPILKQPRPDRSANRKYNEKTKKWEMKPGMPSGHVMNASTTLVWCLLEVTLRGPGFGADDSPLMTWELILLILLTMAPVPWARIYNGDHSLNQCIVGGSLGVVFGIAAYFIRVSFFPMSPGSEWCLGKIGSFPMCVTMGKPWDVVAVDEPASTTAAAVITSLAKEAGKAAASVEDSEESKSSADSTKESGDDKEEEEEEEAH